MDIVSIYAQFIASTGVSTDTRTVKAGNLFFALKGPNFNGNLYAEKALESGAAYAIIDEEKFKKSEKYILVDDVLIALQKLANHHRKQLKCTFIGIAGSNGKTTTKELTFAVLSKKYKTFATKGNLNNHIGVPLTLLSIDNETEMAIIELGANHVGELAELCKIAEPDLGVVTNIGLDHLEGYGSIEGVAEGNSEIYYWLFKNGGKVFVNAQDEWLMRMTSRFESRILYNDFAAFDFISSESKKIFLTISSKNGLFRNTNLTGKYNLDNINTAVKIGTHLGVDLEFCLDAIAEYQPANNRSQVIKKGTNEIILDCYNANPSSMLKSLQSFAELSSNSKYVFLGDMFELGNFSDQEHLNMIKAVEELNINYAYFCGEAFFKHKLMFPKYNFFEKRENLILSTIEESLILIKGSRGMTMEKIVEIL
ncbi:MAG: UDP-N-acetylmuramoyl-tripeptide--D-alanyl-D-alanine ligase [Bacteroidetes bacterium]|nr:MAG: UDP-N-acetylmuramoyl-tripeptide--D-alanyl-D-alanine ligase [Bacteroidota bacterium]